MNFELYRVFVSRLETPNLLTEVKSKRDAYLKAFSNIPQPLYFNVDKQSYVFVVIESKDEDYIYGKIGRRASVTRTLSPEEEFSSEELEDWPTVPVFINLTDDNVRGQSVAISISRKVALKPLKILTALLGELEKRILSDEYKLNINPITRRQEFWDIVKAHKGGVEEVVFSFITPNLFNSSDKMDEELKTANEEMAALGVDIKLENKENGLKLDENQAFTKRAVEYVSDGGGTYTVRVKGMTRIIKNGENVKSTRIEGFQVGNIKNDDQIKAICDRIFSCLSSSE